MYQTALFQQSQQQPISSGTIDIDEFGNLERGDIVWESDPLSEKGRPMLVLWTPQLPNHGTQLITVLLSRRPITRSHSRSGTMTTRANHSVNEVIPSRGRL